MVVGPDGGRDVGGEVWIFGADFGSRGTGWFKMASVVGVAGVGVLMVVATGPGAAGTADLVFVSEPGITAGCVSLMLSFVLSA